LFDASYDPAMIGILLWLGFAEYSGAHRLCQQHVVGNSMHIEWSSYATTDEPAKVLAFYEKALGAKSAAGVHGSRTFDLAGSNGTIKLAMYPAAVADAFPSCSVAPKSDDRTVILVSQAIK
jgi:hypothetical protein